MSGTGDSQEWFRLVNKCMPCAVWQGGELGQQLCTHQPRLLETGTAYQAAQLTGGACATCNCSRLADKPAWRVQFGKVVSSDSSYARTSERNPYFTAAYDAVDGSLSSGGQCKGSLFWEWTVRNPSESIDFSLPNGLHPYGVSVWDETFT